MLLHGVRRREVPLRTGQSPQVWLGVSVRNSSHKLVLQALVSLACRGPTARKPVTADVLNQEHSWTLVLLLECSMEGHKCAISHLNELMHSCIYL